MTISRVLSLWKAVALVSTLSLLALVSLPQAAGAVGPQGALVMEMAFGKSGSALNKQGVKVAVAKPMTRLGGSGGKFVVEAPVGNVTFDGKTRVAFKGSLIFKRKVKGKMRQLRLGRVAFEGSEGTRVITASNGSRRISLFRASGAYSSDPEVGTVVLPNQNLVLTGAGAKLIRKTLRLGKLPASKLGTLVLDSQAAFEDPYAAECELPATTKRTGSLPVAGPLPTLSPSTPLVGDAVTWGFKTSFRGYIFSTGLFEGEGGATVNPAPFPGPPASFTFPFLSGTVSNEGAAKTVESASGSITACHKGQFRLTMTDPAVVIDGDQSRIVMTVDTNVSGDWIVGQRVDFATLDTTGIWPVVADGVTTWTNVPVKLTADGADSLRLCSPGAPPPCLYSAGSDLDPITVRVRTGGA